MDALRRMLAQFQDLFKGMAPSQRLTLVIVPLFVIAALAVLMYTNVGPAEEFLLAGKSFSPDELHHAEDALRRAGLNEFRTEAQKILVPRNQATRYNAALVANGGLPAQFGTELEKLHEKYGLFASDKQRQELLEIAKAKELSKIIRAIPDIEDASVIWERSRGRTFSGESRVTATVSVKPRARRELSSDLIHSIRLAVAGAVADLSAESVTVLNMTTGIAYRTQDRDDPFNSQFIDQIKKFTSLHQRNIADALAYIPNVMVAVNVDLENLKTSWEQERRYDTKAFPLRSVEQTDNTRADERRPNSEPGVKSNMPRDVRQQSSTESTHSSEKSIVSNDNVPISTKLTDKTFIGLLPRSVQVTVAIPKDYYRAVALANGETESEKAAFTAKLQQLETETEKEVAQIVAKLIPSTATGTPVDAINVSSYVRLNSDTPPVTESMVSIISESTARWGGPVGLTLFALWSLWMLNRSMKKLPDVTEPDAAAAARLNPALKPDDEDAAIREPSKRDRLQTLVRDNPELAASVMGRWIIPVK